MNTAMKLVFLGAALLLTACAYPRSAVVQGGSAAGFTFATLPPASTVSIDGRPLGSAAEYATNIVAVTPGTHRVLVTLGGSVLLDRDYYVGREGTVAVSVQ